jgi:hypothetical protein
MKITRALVLGVAFAAAAIAPSVAATPASLTVKMIALNGSGENGTATITQDANGIAVAVSLPGAKGSQPTHIHIGTCANLNKAPEYALKNTVDGKGASTVPGVTIAQLLKGHYAINVHKSAADLATYVSCGNITAH